MCCYLPYNNTPHLIYCVWCGAHQLDLVVQFATRQHLHGAFVQLVTNMTGDLCRQNSLILEMKAKCPWFIDTRWMSMAIVLHWFNANQIRHKQFLDECQHSWKPPLHWWASAIGME